MTLMRRAIGSTSVRSAFIPSRFAIQVTPGEPQAVRMTSCSSLRRSLRSCCDGIHPTSAEAHTDTRWVPPDSMGASCRLVPGFISHRPSLSVFTRHHSAHPGRASWHRARPFKRARVSLKRRARSFTDLQPRHMAHRARIHRPPGEAHLTSRSDSGRLRRDSCHRRGNSPSDAAGCAERVTDTIFIALPFMCLRHKLDAILSKTIQFA